MCLEDCYYVVRAAAKQLERAGDQAKADILYVCCHLLVEMMGPHGEDEVDQLQLVS